MAAYEKRTQSAVDDNYNTALGHLYWDVIQPAMKSTLSFGAGVTSFALRYGGRLTGMQEVTEKAADWVWNNLNGSDIDERVGVPTALKGGLFNNGSIKWTKLLPSTVETLTTMYWLLSPARSAPNNLKDAALFSTSTLLTEPVYRQAGKEAGLQGADLDAFALYSSITTSVLEMINPNAAFTDRKSVV